MAQDFNSFLQGILGGALPQVGVPPVPTPTPMPMPVTPTPVPMQPTPAPVAQPPGLTPAMFEWLQKAQQAQQAPPVQAPIQGPMPVAPPVLLPTTTSPTPPPAVDYNGTWETVEWQNSGTTYYILMPQANTQNLPEGANLIKNGTITNEPDRVARAVEEGNKGQQGDRFSGTLAQMPPEIQGVFRSSDDVYNVSEGRPIEDSVKLDENGIPIRFDQIPVPVTPTSTAPDASGKTLYDYMDTMAAEDKKEANFKREGADQFVINEPSRKPLTTEQLRQSDQGQVPAAILEAAGIFEIPVDRMAVRDAAGKVSLSPLIAPESLPQGTEIITYGGTTPPPDAPGIGEMLSGPMDALSAVNKALEIPKRKSQELISRAVDVLPPQAAQFVSEIVQASTPLGQFTGGPPGVPAFIQWQVENADIADQVRTGGYNGFEGERAVWERFQSDRNVVERAADDIFTDPLNALTSMGAPVRGAARGIGRLAGRETAEEATEQTVRRGIGIADESLDATRRAGAAVDDPAVIRRGISAIDEAAPSAQLLTGAAQRTGQNLIQRGAGVTENVLNTVADVIDIPERALGAVVDVGVSGIKGATGALRENVDWIDRALSSDRVTRRRDNLDPLRNTIEDVLGAERIDPDAGVSPELAGVSPETTGPQVPVKALPEPPANRPYQELENGDIATRDRDGTWTRRNGEGAEVRNGTWNHIASPAPRTVGTAPTVDVPVTTVAGAVTPPTTAGQPPLAPVTRAADDVVVPAEPIQGPLGSAAQPITDTPSPTLATDRPIDDLEQVDPDALVRDEVFRGTREGQYTDKTLAQWPEEVSFLRPQTADQRLAGEGRAGRDFGDRPIDIARTIAPQEPQKWRKFLNEYDRRLNRATGYARLESERLNTYKQFPHFKSDTTAGQFEHGTQLRSTYEMLLEADNLAREEVRIFNLHMGDDAKLPEYTWKRWGSGDNPHTALDALDNGRYRPGTPLAEATELAIFHPEDVVRLDAMNDISARLSLYDGVRPKKINGADLLHPKLKHKPELEQGTYPPLFNDILSSARKSRLSIRNIRDTYWNGVADNQARAKLVDGVDQRLDVNDSRMLSNATTRPQEPVRLDEPIPDAQVTASDNAGNLQQSGVDDTGREVFERDLDPEGAAQFDRDLTARALRDVGSEPAPLALPYTTPQDAIPLGGRGSSGVVVPDNATPLTNPNPAEVTDRAVALRNMVETRGTPKARLAAPMETTTGLFGKRPERLAGKRAERAGRDQSSWQTRMRPDQLNSFYIRGRAPSATQMEQLGRTFKDGESFIDRWDRLTVEKLGKATDDAAINLAERQAAEQTLADFAVDFLDQGELNKYTREVKRLGSTKTPEGDNLTMIERQTRALQSLDTPGRGRGGRGYHQLLSAIREMFLYNPITGSRYVQTQIVGNSSTLGLTGYYTVAGQFLSGTSLKKAIDTAIRKGEAPPSILREAYDGWGLQGPRELVSGNSMIRDQTMSGFGDPLTVSKVPVIGKVLAVKQIRDFAAMADIIPRQLLAVHLMDTNLLVARKALRERMLAQVPGIGSPERAVQLFDSLPQRFSATDVRKTFGEEFDQKWADRHARDWQEALSKTDKAAQAEVKRVFFDGGQTSLDAQLKKVVFFHYWMSRATPLYTEAILRNPVYLYQFANMVEEVQNDDDLSGSKFYKMLTSPMGYNILANPLAMIQTFASVIDDAGYTPEGESLFGTIMRKSPVMVAPPVQFVANMAGLMGDTFAPDPVGFNKWIQLYQAGADTVNAELGLGLPPAGNIQEQTLREIRSWATSKIDWVPGIDPIPLTDAMAYKENEVRSIVAEIALGRGLDLDDPIVQSAMIDPSSEMYQEAMKRYARQDVVDIALRILPVTAVLYPKSQLASPKQRTLGITAEQQSAEQQGIGSTERGRDLYTERDLIYAADEGSRTIQIQEDEYKQLGTPEERAALQFSYGIQFGNTETPVTVSGKTYSPAQLQAMDDASRETLAATWAEETGNTERIETAREARKAYREAHPEYAEKADWANQMNDHEGGPVKWWQDTIPVNRNAELYYNSLTPEQQADPQALTTVEAYLNWKGDRVNYYDPEPASVRDPTKEPYSASESGDGDSSGGTGQGDREKGPTVENISTSIREYQDEVVAYNQVLSQHFGQSVDIDQVNPMAQQAIISNMERDYGVRPPSMGGYAQDYLEWAAAQGGGNATVAAYVDWYKKMNPTKAGAATEPTAEEIQQLIAAG